VGSFERGTKRQCQNCETKFYDLNSDPIICPSCGEKFVVAAAPEPKEAKPKKAPEPEAETKTDSNEAEVEIISLDEADEENEENSENIPEVDDVEVDDNVNADQQDTFLEEDEEDGNKVDLGVPTDMGDEE
jgi:uncharacterized protein (TIGR02300 family)